MFRSGLSGGGSKYRPFRQATLESLQLIDSIFTNEAFTCSVLMDLYVRNGFSKITLPHGFLGKSWAKFPPSIGMKTTSCNDRRCLRIILLLVLCWEADAWAGELGEN